MSAGQLTLVILLETEFVPPLAQDCTTLKMTLKDCVCLDVKQALMDQLMFVSQTLKHARQDNLEMIQPTYVFLSAQQVKELSEIHKANYVYAHAL